MACVNKNDNPTPVRFEASPYVHGHHCGHVSAGSSLTCLAVLQLDPPVVGMEAEGDPSLPRGVCRH